MERLSKYKIPLAAGQLILTILWLTNLIHTDAYFSVYALCAAGSLYCMHLPLKPGKREMAGAAVFSVLLSLAVVLANYPLFEIVRNPAEVSASSNRIMNILEAGVTFLGGIPVFLQLILAFGSAAPGKPRKADKPRKVFLLSFTCIALIDLVYLFFVAYPGNLSPDTMFQLFQIANHQYNNFTPFWHTQIIRWLMGLGYALTGTANGAAAVYNVFQILFMAAVFGYAVMTLYETGASRGWILGAFCLYAFLPYQIAFSASIWKDVLFGGAILLTVTAMLRLLRGMGGRLDRVLLAVGGILTSMSRTNGVYIMLLTFVIILVVMKKQIRSMLLPWVLIVAVGWVLNGPVLSFLGIDTVRNVEVMSVPVQQITRTVIDGGEINPQDREMLSRVMPLEEVAGIYTPNSADPMKDVLTTTDIDYLESHQKEFLMVWLRTGLKNPGSYLKAWIDVTKGYWNGGYDYYIYAEFIPDNEYGLATDVSPTLIWRLVKAYFAFTREAILFQPLQSIGLMAWMILLVFYLNVLHRSRDALACVPLLIVMLGLWIGAPVYSEFRYLYPLFNAFPLLFPVALHGTRNTP